jgi:hypothetical protein
MTLTCPRCSTNVSEDALYCSYCNLPKPKSGFSAIRAEDQHQQQVQKHQPARPSKSTAPAKNDDRPRRRQSQVHDLSVAKLAGVAVIALLAIGGYVYFSPLARSYEPEPKTVLAALDTLKRMPSNEEGLSIDARLNRDLETSKRMRKLVAYQGWTVKRVDGTKSRVILIFSYDEVDRSHHQAEWLADLDHNQFTPQSELAVSISK